MLKLCESVEVPHKVLFVKIEPTLILVVVHREISDLGRSHQELSVILLLIGLRPQLHAVLEEQLDEPHHFSDHFA